MRAATKIAAWGLILCSPILYAFLGRWEGASEYVVYADRLAGGKPTVCRGLTSGVTTTPIIVGERWSPEKCEREERAAMERVQLALVACFRRKPPQSVFDAASSHAWNFGPDATCGSAAMKAWNRGEWMLGCRRLQLSDSGSPVWSYVKDGVDAQGQQKYKFVQGLANRRAKERQLCESGVPKSTQLLKFTVE